ncbi:AlbA family DNA-binding domain-containing protein [Lysobacter tyrosinilyticus]
METTEQWLHAIVDRAEPETVTLDFKRQLPSDKDRKSFLHDVTALANTWGGRIVYGVVETEGRASAFAPLQGDADAEATRLLNIAASGCIEPRVAGLRIDSVKIAGGFAMVVEVPQQFDGPFRAQLEGKMWFKCRVGQVNQEMTYMQLRHAFGERNRLLEQLRAWRHARVQRIQELMLSQQLANNSYAVLHVLPLASFAKQFSFDLKKLERYGFAFSSGPHAMRRYNSEGLLFSPFPSNIQLQEYAQCFRRGMVEVAWKCRHRLDDGRDTVDSITCSNKTKSALERVSELLTREGLSGAVAFGISLIGIRSHYLLYAGNGFEQVTSAQPHDEVFIYEERFSDRVEDLYSSSGALSKQLLDEVWQTFDLDECRDFDESGEWRRHTQPYR